MKKITTVWNCMFVIVCVCSYFDLNLEMIPPPLFQLPLVRMTRPPRSRNTSVPTIL